jgi:hypothetical protein
MTRLVPLAAAALAAAPGLATAGPISPGTFTVSVVNTQLVELAPGTPFNPGPDPVVLPVAAAGRLTVTVGPEDAGGNYPTSPVAVLTGSFPFPFTVLAGTPDLPASRGLIFNIVPDPADPDGLLSADFREEAYFKLVLPDGTTVYTDPADPAVFTATLTGVPYPAGTTFLSPESVNLYLQLGPGYDPARDLLVGRSFDRVLTVVPTAVPEPASLTLVGVGAAGLVGARFRRRAAHP